jgi:hypothetical protein
MAPRVRSHAPSTRALSPPDGSTYLKRFRRQALTTENSADGAGDGPKVPGSSQGAEATEDEVDIDIDIATELVEDAPQKEKRTQRA